MVALKELIETFCKRDTGLWFENDLEKSFRLMLPLRPRHEAYCVWAIRQNHSLDTRTVFPDPIPYPSIV